MSISPAEGRRVPVRWISQIADFLQVAHAFQMRKHLLCVLEEVWKHGHHGACVEQKRD